jgi:replication factor C subunit 3/5
LEKLEKKLVKYEIKINNNLVSINCMQSPYHFEINLFEYGLYDKQVLCTFVKELAQTRDITGRFKLIVFDRFDDVSLLGQCALRRMMETMVNNCRFILIVNQLSKIDDPIISRCFSVRLGFPKKEELMNYITTVSDKFNLNLSKTRQQLIIRNCPNDLYKLNIMILNPNIINVNPIEKFIITIHKILTSKNILFLDEIRPIIYKLHLLDYSVADIIKAYIKFCIKNEVFNDSEMIDIVEAGALNEYKSVMSNKVFFCLEKFFIVIKSIINNL